MKTVLIGMVAAIALQPTELNDGPLKKYRRDLIRNTRIVWGLQAPVSTFAAQIHAESGGRANVCSRAGACGLSQFMPATAKAMSKRYKLGPADRLNPVWSMRAMLYYDREIWESVYARDPCQRMRYTMIGYNRGPARMYRKKLPRETSRYLHRIFNLYEPAYVRSGWGAGSCTV
jgi:soluble lytic murein transglycosylase-like protein